MSYGSHDTGDPNTTNLYIGNINPKVFCLFDPLCSSINHDNNIDLDNSNL